MALAKPPMQPPHVNTPPQIVTSAGLDSAVYIRLLTFGMELMAYLTVFCCVLQLPVNLTVGATACLCAHTHTSGACARVKGYEATTLLCVPALTKHAPRVCLPTPQDNNIDQLMSENNTEYTFTGFDKLGLANVQEGSSRMWVHMLSVYFILGIAMWVSRAPTHRHALPPGAHTGSAFVPCAWVCATCARSAH
jgi:hypothetical protein